MKKLFVVMVSMALIVTVAVSPVWAVGDKVRSDKAAGPAGETGDGDSQASRGTPVEESAQFLGVQEDMAGKKNQSGTTAILTDEEIAAMLFMREEEKLARDVYLELGKEWDLGVFWNIAESEQQHMDAILKLLAKYGLDDPAADKEIGEFFNQDLQILYNDLLNRGIQSLLEALRVGIEIEETDINDLTTHLEDENITKDDIRRVFKNLRAGSYNHLDAFNSHLSE